MTWISLLPRLSQPKRWVHAPAEPCPGSWLPWQHDCPLLIAVGGTLISEGHLDPARLASGAAFREEIITAFRDAITEPDPAADPGIRQEVLKAIAAVQPFRVDQAAFRSALSGLAGKPFDQLVPHIRHLEEAGVLIRRGNSLRIAPDLLGDVILSEAAADLPHGVSTEYLERVLTSAEGDCLLHLVTNVSRIDWQIRAGAVRTGLSLAESLWPMITSRFRSGGITARLQILDMLTRVAFYQPAAAINLVRLAMADPAPDGQRPSSADRRTPGLPTSRLWEAAGDPGERRLQPGTSAAGRKLAVGTGSEGRSSAQPAPGAPDPGPATTDRVQHRQARQLPRPAHRCCSAAGYASLTLKTGGIRHSRSSNRSWQQA